MYSKISFSALAIALCFSSPVMAVEPGSWRCEKQPIFHKDVMAGIVSISSKSSVRNVIFEYMKRYDAKEIRAACEAFAAGQPSDISCLNGRRDWNQISASMPDDFIGLSAMQHREHLLKIQSEGDGLDQAYKYCESVGALRDDGFSLEVGDG